MFLLLVLISVNAFAAIRGKHITWDSSLKILDLLPFIIVAVAYGIIRYLLKKRFVRKDHQKNLFLAKFDKLRSSVSTESDLGISQKNRLIHLVGKLRDEYFLNNNLNLINEYGQIKAILSDGTFNKEVNGLLEGDFMIIKEHGQNEIVNHNYDMIYNRVTVAAVLWYEKHSENNNHYRADSLFDKL